MALIAKSGCLVAHSLRASNAKCDSIPSATTVNNYWNDRLAKWEGLLFRWYYYSYRIATMTRSLWLLKYILASFKSESLKTLWIQRSNETVMFVKSASNLPSAGFIWRINHQPLRNPTIDSCSYREKTNPTTTHLGNSLTGVLILDES